MREASGRHPVRTAGGRPIAPAACGGLPRLATAQAEAAPASAPAARRHTAQRGFTFIEISMVMALTALLALVIERTITTTVRADDQIEANRRAAERSEKIIYEIQGDVLRSRRLFAGDAVGTAYLAALDLTRDPIRATARLPRLDEFLPLGPDAPGDPRTGNILFFARESDVADPLTDVDTGSVHYVDLYRFICVYPRPTDRVVIVDADKAKADDLVIWRSVRFPNLAQLRAITDDTQRAAAVSDLVNRFKCEVAWDPNGDADASFFGLTAAGGIDASPIQDFQIPEDVDMSDRGRLVYADCQLAPTRDEETRRAVFTSDAPESWVPDGFEVKVVGSSGSRKVWMHLVVETHQGVGAVGAWASTVIASTRDM